MPWVCWSEAILTTTFTLLHYSNCLHPTFSSWVPPLCPCTEYPITPLAFVFLSWVATVLIVRSNLQRRAIMELFKDAGVLLTNLFPMVVVNDMSYGYSQYGWVVLKWKSTPTFHSPYTLNVSFYMKQRSIRRLQFSHCGPFFGSYFSQTHFRAFSNSSSSIKCRISA